MDPRLHDLLIFQLDRELTCHQSRVSDLEDRLFKRIRSRELAQQVELSRTVKRLQKERLELTESLLCYGPRLNQLSYHNHKYLLIILQVILKISAASPLKYRVCPNTITQISANISLLINIHPTQYIIPFRLDLAYL